MAGFSHLTNADRSVARTRVLMTAVLLTRDGAMNVRVQDLSATGARILTKRGVQHSSDAIFKRGALFAAAHIAWSEDGKAGLNFYRELSPAEMDCAFNAAAPSALPATPRASGPIQRPLGNAAHTP